MSFRYILRYYIDPGYNEEERIAELETICREGQIEEVMLFYNPEELFQGYPTGEELENWFSMAGKVKAKLDSLGVAMSLNPWTTLVHLARGRHFTEAQKNWQPMIGETGVPAKMTVCPFDKNWQADIGALWARMARELNPTTIWVEDDFRLCNHDPEMDFGGCFCPLHLQEFEKRAGVKTDRETLMNTILQEGEPHPWRKIFLEVSRDSMESAARAIYKAVHEANPSVRLGLMCSDPDTHSIEGRDWERLKNILSPDQPLQLRPCWLGCYTEIYGLICIPAITRMTISEFTSPIEIYPEMENSPRSGIYSKSAAFSIMHSLHAALYGSHGITINHFDMNGTGLALDYNFCPALGKAKPFLDAIADLELDDKNSMGVTVLHSPEASLNMHTGLQEPGGIGRKARHLTMYRLFDKTVTWGRILPVLGISCKFSPKPCPGTIHAASNQVLRNFSDEEIKTMLSGPVILDAPSVEVLLDRGFGSWIGIRSTTRTKQVESAYAHEDIPDGTKAEYGVDAPRMDSQRLAEMVIKMELLPGAETKSVIRKYDRSALFAGAVFYENEAGGRILSLAYPLETYAFSVAFYNNFRRIFMQKMVRELAPEGKVLLAEEFPLHTFRTSGKGADDLLGFVNPTHDVCSRVKWIAPGFDGENAEYLTPEGKWEKAELRKEGDSWIWDRPLEVLKAAVFRTRK